MTYRLSDPHTAAHLLGVSGSVAGRYRSWGALLELDISGEDARYDLRLDEDRSDRISHLANIILGLQRIFGAESPAARAWLTTPNRAFKGRSPLVVMRDGGLDGILRVRHYIERLQ